MSVVDPIEFPLNGVRRVSGSVLFSTDVQDGVSGEEVRAATWQDSLREFDARQGIRTLEDVRLVRSFFYACMGREIGFLLRDWSDYEATHSESAIAGGAGAYERGHSSPVGGSDTVFQLEKIYHNGYRPHRRKITRPKAGTVTLHDSAGDPIASGYTVDYLTGKATFTSPQAAAPHWAGQFLCPVRFVEDELPWDVIKYAVATKRGMGEMPNVLLIEVRE